MSGNPQVTARLAPTDLAACFEPAWYFRNVDAIYRRAGLLGGFPDMEKWDKLYEGKAKIVYATDDPGKVIQYFKDDATAFNAAKRGTIVGKGVINNKMSAALFQRLGKAGIPTHYLATLSDREMLCRKLDIIKIEVIPRNMVAGTLAKPPGLEEGVAIKPPIVELFYK